MIIVWIEQILVSGSNIWYLNQFKNFEGFSTSGNMQGSEFTSVKAQGIQEQGYVKAGVARSIRKDDA